MEALGGGVPSVLRTPHTGQEVDVMQGEGCFPPWIDDAMSRCQDNIGRDEGSRTPVGPSVASNIDLSYGLPGCSPCISTDAIVFTNEARSEFPTRRCRN